MGDVIFGHMYMLFSHDEFEQWLNRIVSASPMTAISAGIGLTIAGSCLMAVGSVVMKIGIHTESKRLQRDIQVPFTSYLWWLGLLTYSVGAFLHLVGLAFAPASVLAPLNSLGLVANAAGAITFLDEKLSIMDGVWTMSTMIGVALCALSSFLPHDESAVVDGIQSWTDPLYISYVIICGLSLLIILLLINHGEARAAEEQYEFAYKQHLADGHIELSELAKALAKGMKRDDPNIEFRTNLLKDVLEERKKAYDDIGWNDITEIYPPHVGLLYSVVAGIVGAQCVLQLKEFAAFLKLSVVNPHVWFWIQPYLSGIFGVVSIILQMHFLNLGLARGDATLVIPAYYVSWTIFGTFGGFAKFHEIFGFSALQVGIFGFGLVITLASIVLMATGEVKRVKVEIETTIPVRQRGLSEDVAERPLKFGVPLGMGLGIIPIGRLAGRLRPLPADIARWLEKATEPTQFTWTVTGSSPPIVARRSETNDSRLGAYKAVPTTEAIPEYSGRVAERVLAVPQIQRARKYKTLDEICFEPEMEHSTTPPDVLLSHLLSLNQEADEYMVQYNRSAIN